MSVKKIKRFIYLCKCEAKDQTTGEVCGYEWESDHIPDRCARCKKYTWNRKNLVAGREGNPIKLMGKTQTIAAWAREYGIGKATVHRRIKLGWTLKDAITMPVRKL